MHNHGKHVERQQDHEALMANGTVPEYVAAGVLQHILPILAPDVEVIEQHLYCLLKQQTVVWCCVAMYII